MALQRKKDGSPNIKYFESLESIAQFDPVRSWLLKNCKKVIRLKFMNRGHDGALFLVLLQTRPNAC